MSNADKETKERRSFTGRFLDLALALGALSIGVHLFGDIFKYKG
jgi:hypothetical protein